MMSDLQSGAEEIEYYLATDYDKLQEQLRLAGAELSSLCEHFDFMPDSVAELLREIDATTSKDQSQP